MAVRTPYAGTAITQHLIQRRNAISDRKTQTEIATEMGYDATNHLSNILYGRSALPAEKFCDAMRAFEIPVSEHSQYFIMAMTAYTNNNAWASMWRCLNEIDRDQFLDVLSKIDRLQSKRVAKRGPVRD